MSLNRDENGTFGYVQKDMFQEIANIGAGHATSALSMMLDCEVDQDLPDVELVELASMQERMGGAERPVVTVVTSVTGDVSGYLLAIMDPPQAERIIRMVRNGEMDPLPEGKAFSDIDESALCEVMNIMGSSYLMAIAQMTGLSMTPSSPHTAMDMLGAALSIALVQAGMEGDYILYFKSVLKAKGKSDFKTDLLLAPDNKSYKLLLSSLGM